MNIDLTALPRIIETPAQAVWVKSNWSDPFVLRPDLIATQTVDSLAPDLPTATLHYQYGRVSIPGSPQYVDYPVITDWGFYVLVHWWIVIDGTPHSRWWLGSSDPPVTTPIRGARDGIPAAGTQTIPCFGLERALQLSLVRSSIVDGGITPGEGGAPDTANDPKRFPTGSIFNDTLAGNRSTLGDADTFAPVRSDDVDTWSSRDIVGHLAAYHLPQPNGDGTLLPWSVGSLTAVPDWDAPRIETDNRTVFDLLSEVLSADRLLGWTIRPTIGSGETPTITDLQITPVTRTDVAIDLQGVGNLPANPRTHTITGAADPLTIIDVTSDAASLVNQIIVEGPREIGICTLTYDDLEKGWESTDEDAYSDGARLESGWTDLKQYEQRTANERVREKSTYNDVFRSLKLPDDWDGNADTSDRVFIQDEDSEGTKTDHQPNVRTIQLLESLHLYEGVDYEGDPTTVDESAGKRFRSIEFMIQRPDATFEPLEKLGVLSSGSAAKSAGINHTVSGDPDNREGAGFRLSIAGGPPHAIAGPGFVGNPADVRQASFGGYGYSDIIVTTAIMGDRRPFYAMPTDADLGDLDIVRRRVIRVEHPSTTHVHIAAATVVGLDSAGDKLTSDGGVLRDPTEVLRALCILAAKSQVTGTKRVELTTSRLIDGVWVGDVIAGVDGQQTSSTVLQIKIDAPIAQDNQLPDAARLTITAAGTTVDIIRLLADPS
ncbi:hypothetical protein K227x_64190 [Rubripirellula lacrimiformis]|uniref:Uncharacterized protein n=1 Tax=Rubripirellula lacrimiformis TaxID=1930273 RepID=A0A517NLN0_9BACT|nr:hypothetical protein [Rubripirellula lacrimiformis]QDT07989.1 hypothetical protein K227x_64190 [Rubripirellula lacrimiformis]